MPIGRRPMKEAELILEWLGVIAFVVVFVLLVWDPVVSKFSEWRIKRAFRRRDKMDR